MTKRSSLRPDIQRALTQLDAMPDRAVIIDEYGDAWQYSRYLCEWFRAFDGDGRSSWEVAQRVGKFSSASTIETLPVRYGD